MEKIILITGNSKKAEYFSKYLGMEINHIDVDLDEIQSFDLNKIVEHKVKQAYEIIKKPVLVEDVSLQFDALGQLPGPFIKFFMQSLSLQGICDLLENKSKQAVASCVIGYYDGNELKLFEGRLKGSIVANPVGENGFGWDKIFIPEGYEITRAEMNEVDDSNTYLKIKRLDLVRKYIETKN